MIEGNIHRGTQSQIITWMRLPLIIGVVMVHANLYDIVLNWTGEAPHWPEWLILLFRHFNDVLFPKRVPVLFIISGYLFFKGANSMEPHFFRNKLKRRVHSLLIPYMAWNTLALLLFYVKSSNVLGDVSLQSGEEFSLLKYLSGYWSFYFTEGVPVNGPLWFVRNLMVVCLLTPLLYRLLRGRLGWLFLLFAAVCVSCEFLIPIHGFDIFSILFFSIGAWLQLHNVNIINIPPVMGWIAVAMYFPVSYFQFGLYDDSWYMACSLVAVLVKAVAMVFVISELFRCRILRSVPKIAEQTFYLYALHGLIIGPVIKPLYILSGYTNNPLLLLSISLLAVLIVIFISSASYNLLKKYTPSFLKILSGGR